MLGAQALIEPCELWQHAAPMSRPKARSGVTSKTPDLEPQSFCQPVDAVPSTVEVTQRPLIDAARSTWILGSLILVASVGFFTFLWRISENLQKLDGRVMLVEHRVGALEKWAKDPKVFPAASNFDATSSAEPSSKQEPSPVAQGQRHSVMSIPSNIAPKDPPVCVHKATKRLFPCERAKSCVGHEAYAPAFFQKILEQAGAVGRSSVLVCDQR